MLNSDPTFRGPSVTLAIVAAAAATAAALAVALLQLPAALVFPVTGAGLLLTAAVMALLALATPAEVPRRDRIFFWDFAGVLALFGLCAALFGEPEQAVALLERDRI